MADEFEVLARWRAGRYAERLPAPFNHPGGLSYRRAWVIALNRARGTEQELQHVQSCRHCSYLVRACELQLPHRPWWELLCWVLGLLPAETARVVAEHVEEEQCVRCWERCEVVRAGLDQVVQFQGSLALPDPEPLLAREAGPLDHRFRSRDNHSLEARLVRRNDKVQLLVRTKDRRLRGRWVGYSLTGAPQSEPITGFTVLREDVNDWLAALTEIPIEDLSQRLRGTCRGLLLCPVHPSELTSADHDAVAASVLRCCNPDDRRDLADIQGQLQP